MKHIFKPPVIPAAARFQSQWLALLGSLLCAAVLLPPNAGAAQKDESQAPQYKRFIGKTLITLTNGSVWTNTKKNRQALRQTYLEFWPHNLALDVFRATNVAQFPAGTRAKLESVIYVSRFDYEETFARGTLFLTNGSPIEFETPWSVVYPDGSPYFDLADLLPTKVQILPEGKTPDLPYYTGLSRSSRRSPCRLKRRVLNELATQADANNVPALIWRLVHSADHQRCLFESQYVFYPK